MSAGSARSVMWLATAPCNRRFFSQPGAGLFPRASPRRKLQWCSPGWHGAPSPDHGLSAVTPQPMARHAMAGAAASAGAAQTAWPFEAFGVQPGELDVEVTMSYEVKNICTLDVTGTLDPNVADGKFATTAAILACLMNVHEERTRALRRAVNHMLAHHPGVLEGALITKLGPAGGNGGAVGKAPIMKALEFQHLYAICKALVPAMKETIDEEMVQELATVAKPLASEPKSSGGEGGGGPSGGGSSSQPSEKEQQIHAVMELMNRPKWSEWKMRMRTALVAWARRQPQEARPATELGCIKCTLHVDALSPDNLPFKQRIAIRLKGPGAERMLGMMEAIYISAAQSKRLQDGARLTGSGLGGIASLFNGQEDTLQDRLLTLAMNAVALTTADSFECSLEVQQGAGAGSGGSGCKSGSGAGTVIALESVGASSSTAAAGAPAAAAPAGSVSNGGGAGGTAGARASFAGSGVDLRTVVAALASLEGSEFSALGQATQGWYPSNFRIRFQRYIIGEQQRYRLQIFPPGMPLPPAPSSLRERLLLPLMPQPQPELELDLSRKQLWALIDCLDAFCHSHPAFVQLVPPPIS